MSKGNVVMAKKRKKRSRKSKEGLESFLLFALGLAAGIFSGYQWARARALEKYSVDILSA
jgi:hypothetical protein